MRQTPWWKATCFSSNEDQRLTPMEFVIHYWVLRTMGSPGAESHLGAKSACYYSFPKRQGENKEHQKRGNNGTQTSKGGTAQTWGEGGRGKLWPSPEDVVPTPHPSPLRHANRWLWYLQQEDAEPMGSEQHGCLDKTHTVTPVGLSVWMREISHGPTYMESYRGVMAKRETQSSAETRLLIGYWIPSGQP